MSKIGFHKAQGFTLIEILVSTIILAIGLLGLASMQTLALKDNQDAFFYAQASSLAYEMSDRIKVNADAWKGTIPTPATDCSNNCNSVANSCTPDTMAAYDYCAWKANVTSRIGSTATATVAASPSGSICTGGSSQRCITITWNLNKALGSNTTSSFQLEMTP